MALKHGELLYGECGIGLESTDDAILQGLIEDKSLDLSFMLAEPEP